MVALKEKNKKKENDFQSIKLKLDKETQLF